MKRSDLYDETLRVQISLAHTCLDVILLCLDDPSDLARAVAQMTVDSVVVLAEEMQERMSQRAYAGTIHH